MFIPTRSTLRALTVIRIRRSQTLDADIPVTVATAIQHAACGLCVRTYITMKGRIVCTNDERMSVMMIGTINVPGSHYAQRHESTRYLIGTHSVYAFGGKVNTTVV